MQEFKVILGHVVSLTPAPGTGDPVPNKQSTEPEVLNEELSKIQVDTPSLMHNQVL